MLRTIPRTSEQCLLLFQMPILCLLIAFRKTWNGSSHTIIGERCGIVIPEIQDETSSDSSSGLPPRPQRSQFNCGIPWEAAFECHFLGTHNCLVLLQPSWVKPSPPGAASPAVGRPGPASTSTINTRHRPPSQVRVTLPVCLSSGATAPGWQTHPSGWRHYTGTLFPLQLQLVKHSYFVLYRCIMPWTISTEGFPLKKEIWSGSCFEGESGAASRSLLWSSCLFLSSADAASEDFLPSMAAFVSSFTNQSFHIINGTLQTPAVPKAQPACTPQRPEKSNYNPGKQQNDTPLIFAVPGETLELPITQHEPLAGPRCCGSS